MSSQDVTKSTSRFNNRIKETKIVEVICSMHPSSLHGTQPGLMWTAVALHFAAPSGHSRHCCQLVLFSTVTPACDQINKAVSIVFMAASWPGPARFTNVKLSGQVLQPAPS